MKLLTTLISVEGSDGEHTVMAFNPAGNVWFVSSEHFTPEMKQLQMDVEASGKITVLGALFQGETK